MNTNNKCHVKKKNHVMLKKTQNINRGTSCQRMQVDSKSAWTNLGEVKPIK